MEVTAILTLWSILSLRWCPGESPTRWLQLWRGTLLRNGWLLCSEHFIDVWLIGIYIFSHCINIIIIMIMDNNISDNLKSLKIEDITIEKLAIWKCTVPRSWLFQLLISTSYFNFLFQLVYSIFMLIFFTFQVFNTFTAANRQMADTLLKG